MGKKVLVVGGAGQAGRIHISNLVSLGVDVGCYDLFVNQQCKFNYDAKVSSYEKAVNDGFRTVVVALPDHMLFNETRKILQIEQVHCVLIEKPGALKSSDLKQLVDLADKNNVHFFIDYQRSFDPRVAEFSNKVMRMLSDGFALEYISVFSCDKAQPPQPAHQALNQGCHDYAMLLTVLDIAQLKIDTMSSLGLPWNGTKDTRFLKITGTASNQKGSALFDVQMGRVNSTGTFTEVNARFSKYNADKNMYESREEKLVFPLIPNENALWSDTWKASFTKSMEAILIFTEDECGDGVFMNGTGEHHDPTKGVPFPVPASFGVKVLAFAERVLETLK